MKPWRLAAGLAAGLASMLLGALLALAFAGWLAPDNVLALTLAQAFCQ
ncbi:MAG TPA: hypothetical protein VFY24_02970 [Azospira sp.]|nr:hypothetical protein [Azospira sp.]